MKINQKNISNWIVALTGLVLAIFAVLTYIKMVQKDSASQTQLPFIEKQNIGDIKNKNGPIIINTGSGQINVTKPEQESNIDKKVKKTKQSEQEIKKIDQPITLLEKQKTTEKHQSVFKHNQQMPDKNISKSTFTFSGFSIADKELLEKTLDHIGVKSANIQLLNSARTGGKNAFINITRKDGTAYKSNFGVPTTHPAIAISNELKKKL